MKYKAALQATKPHRATNAISASIVGTSPLGSNVMYRKSSIGQPPAPQEHMQLAPNRRARQVAIAKRGSIAILLSRPVDEGRVAFQSVANALGFPSSKGILTNAWHIHGSGDLPAAVRSPLPDRRHRGAL